MKRENPKNALLEAGLELMKRFCDKNQIGLSLKVKLLHPGDRAYEWINTCAFYSKGTIHIAVLKCAYPGNGVRSWSWPGNVVDRTPYGVIQHELGHHVEATNWPMYKQWLRDSSAEKPITSYVGAGRPNDPRSGSMGEVFAEMFRLFVTNPTLLRDIRPRCYKVFDSWYHTVETRHWKKVLENAPGGILRAAENKVLKTKVRRREE